MSEPVGRASEEAAEKDYAALLEHRFPLPLVLLVVTTGVITVLFLVLLFSMGTSRRQLRVMNEEFARSSEVTLELMLWDVRLTDLAIDASQTSSALLMRRYEAEAERWDEFRQELAESFEGVQEAAEPIAALDKVVVTMLELEGAAIATGASVMDDQVYHSLKARYAAIIADLWEVNSATVAAIARLRNEMHNRALWLLVCGLLFTPLLTLVILRLFDAYRSALVGTLVSLQAERSAVVAANEELAAAYDRTLEGWVAALDLRDKETEGHSMRVTAMAVELAREFGFEGAELENVRRGALLHDIGKLGIPDAVLLKPGALDADERRLIEQHPVYAYAWLKGISYLAGALPIPYSHHERWDGRGYPQGLKGTEIPLQARIFAVIDVWDALRSDRPYRRAWPEEKVMAQLQKEAGTHFDPEVVSKFMDFLRSERQIEHEPPAAEG